MPINIQCENIEKFLLVSDERVRETKNGSALPKNLTLIEVRTRRSLILWGAAGVRRKADCEREGVMASFWHLQLTGTYVLKK